MRIKFRNRRMLMIRHWIMNAGADSFALQVLRQLIASFGSDDVHVVNGVRPFFLGRRLHDPAETFGVTSSNAPPMLIQLVDVAQFHTANRGLDFVKAVVVANRLVDVFRFASVVAQHAQIVCERAVVGRDAAAVAHDREIFRRIKRERASNAH